MKEDWTKQMKEKLEGHQMTPPSGLWEDIIREMDLKVSSAPQPAHSRRWYWAAAAAIIAIVGFFALYDSRNVEGGMWNEEGGMRNVEVSRKEEGGRRKENTPAENRTVISSKTVLLAHANVTNKVESETNDSRNEEGGMRNEECGMRNEDDSENEVIDLPLATEVTQEGGISNENTPEAESSHPGNLIPHSTFLIPHSTFHIPHSTPSRSTKTRWTLGLSGSNGVLLAASDYVNSTRKQEIYSYSDAGNSQVSPTEGPAEMTNWSKYYNDKVLPYSITDIEAKHHIPVRFGLSLQYQLSRSIALASGISYTYLKSEFSIPLYNNLGYTQKLRYLGLPLGISWKILTAKDFSVYLSGGMMLEKCISSEASSGKISKHPWQWSVNGSVGAEYSIIRQLGIYLEPSLGYYFDDGTSLQHYYKDHPLAPSIQFGVRYHLK